MQLNCSYSGAAKSLTLPKGSYKLEVWGAQGGTYSTAATKGGYSVGTLSLSSSSTLLYLVAGGQGTGGTAKSYSGGFNGGGSCSTSNSSGCYGGSGGGGSDIRIGTDSFLARVIVAGGAGGSVQRNSSQGGYGGGSSGGNGTNPNPSYRNGLGGTQTSPGGYSDSSPSNITSYTAAAFGSGASIASSSGGSGWSVAGGGGGWYGGGAGTAAAAGGGSGFVWTGSSAPSGYLCTSTHYLTSSSTKAGNTSFTSPTGASETGHSGNGYCRITRVS